MLTRELLTFAMLASLGGFEAQVEGHVEGHLNVGNDRARLPSVLTALIPFIGYPRTPQCPGWPRRRLAVP